MSNDYLPEGMDIEWLILADAAEINGGKLYLLGGGFNQINVTSSLPQRRHMALAVSISVPWAQTNERHRLTLDFMDEDGNRQANVDGEFEAGRPPGATAGQPQRIQLALQAEVELKKFGSNYIVGKVDGVESRRVHYNVQPTPQLAQVMEDQKRRGGG